MPGTEREAAEISGFINLLKPPGITSHTAVAEVRRLLQVKTGHAGTLDPAAAGVLVICLGRATRLASFAADSPKRYRAEVTFGLATDTLDAEGRVTEESDASGLEEHALRSIIAGFTGEVEQIPPAFSALQVGGKRLYELARKGQQVSPQARKVTVHGIELIAFSPGQRATAMLDIRCGKGTYVRSLCADIGRALGQPAYVSFLLRTAVGDFRISESKTLEEVGQAVAEARPAELLLPPDEPLKGLAHTVVAPAEARLLINGSAVRWDGPAAAMVRVYDRQGNLIALAKAEQGGVLCPTLVLARREQP